MVIVSKQLKVPSMEKQLSDYVEGDIIKVPENGTPVEFYVAKHDYESGLNGAGRTLVVRKDCYDFRQWDTMYYASAYATSAIDNWLNSTYKNMIDVDVRTLIGYTKFYYTIGSGNETKTTLSRNVFLLSVTELGQSDSWANVEGSALPIADILKIAHLNGNTSAQWTRSPTTVGNGVFLLYANGSVGYNDCIMNYGSRPVFTLPATTKFDPDTNVIIG